MSRPAWLRLPWLFNRRIGIALLWTLLVVAAAAAVNIAGIHVVGGVEGWQHWLQAHAGHFFVWRLCLYGATAYLITTLAKPSITVYNHSTSCWLARG